MRRLVPLLLLLAPVAYAAESTVQVQISLTYYTCINPLSKPACIASRPSTEKCAGCKGWQKNNYGAMQTVTTTATLKPANTFAADVAKQLGYDQATNWTSQELYEHPEAHGFVEVPTSASKEGTIAVWPNLTGLVVKDAKQSGQATVLYPSTKKGSTAKGTVKFLGTKQPKYLIPEATLERAAKPQ
jgi:hypothetical protein